MKPRKRARHAGAKAERHARKKWNLNTESTKWNDARTKDGEPVEIKAAIVKKSDGNPGRFLIRRESHRRLQIADGWIIWVAWRPRGRGVEIIESRRERARAVQINNWVTVTGAPNRNAEKQIPINKVF